MKINRIDGPANLPTPRRRMPSKYNLTKLASDSFFLDSLSFKKLPGSIIIRRIVYILNLSLNVFILYVRLSSYYYLQNPRAAQIFDIFERSMFLLNNVIISTGPFYINLDHFCEKFDSIWTQMIITQGTICETFISSEIKKINRELIIMLLLGTLALIGSSAIAIKGSGHLWQTLIISSAISYTLYLNIGYIYILRLSVCLIKSGFQSIESRLETCSVMLANVGQIRLCRQNHNQMIQLIDLLQTTFKHVFSAFICLFIPQFVLGFYQVTTSSNSTMQNVLSIGWNFIYFYYVLSLAKGLTLLNTIPQSYYLTLYQTSFGSISRLVKLEINHYLNFVASKDVGFRLWGNFLVDAHLIPKLCAVLFSYLTGVASFLE